MKHEEKSKKLNHVAGKKDQLTVVLEDMNSQFKAFGESLDVVKRNLKVVKKRGDEIFEEVGNIKVEITAIKMNATEMKKEITGIGTELTEIKTRLDSIEKKLNRIENKPAEAQAEIESLKKESMEIKSCSDDKDVQERLNIFEARIGQIEKRLKLSAA
jgi:chromosome segregation ATPase